MAKKLNFTDQYDENYPNSYWRVVQVNLSKADRNGNVVFYGYPDQDHAGKRIIGQKSYPVHGKDYDDYFSATAINPEGVNHLKQSYEYADSVLDKDSGQINNDGSKIFVSFFDGSENV